MKHVSLLLLVAVSLLVACGPAALPSPTSQSTAPPTEEVPGPPAPGGEAEPGGREAVFPNTIIVYQREGRFPGSPQQWTFYHTGRIVAADGTEWQVPAEEVKPLFDLVEAPDFWLLKSSYAPAGECLDCLVHTLIIYREGEIKEIIITQEPLDVPEDLRQALDEIDSLISSEAPDIMEESGSATLGQ